MQQFVKQVEPQLSQFIKMDSYLEVLKFATIALSNCLCCHPEILSERWNCSPADVPFVKEEPLFGLREIDMHILVNAADDENFLIVPYWLTSVEFFWLFKRAFHAFNLSILGVEHEAVTNPSIVSSKDHDL